MSRIKVIKAAVNAGMSAIKKSGSAKNLANVATRASKVASNLDDSILTFRMRTDYGDVFIKSTASDIATQAKALANDKTVRNIINQQNTGTPRDVSQHDVRRILGIMGYGSKPAAQRGDHYKFKKPGWPNFFYSGTKKGVDPNTIEQLENFFRDVYNLFPKK